MSAIREWAKCAGQGMLAVLLVLRVDVDREPEMAATTREEARVMAACAAKGTTPDCPVCWRGIEFGCHPAAWPRFSFLAGSGEMRSRHENGPRSPPA